MILNNPVTSNIAATPGAQLFPVSKVDFQREVYCIMGLPVDAIGFDETCERVRYAAMNRKRCFINTPNLNILIACLKDADYRDSIIAADLLIADGMPLVWMARLMRQPIYERVSGSNLISALREQAGPAIPLYFFGGNDGVAKIASEKLGQAEHGLCSAGYYAPGFGSLEEMSTQAVLDKVNRSNAGILAVAIGAQRGQLWLTNNQSRLAAPVMANLGATINFIAGTVKRAPVWMQKTGLEWLYRIKEEPNLWRRYRDDALVMARLLIKNILPCALNARYVPSQAERANTTHVCTRTGSTIMIELSGAWTKDMLAPLRMTLKEIGDSADNPSPVTLNFKKVTYVDSGMLGLLLLLYSHQLRHGQPLKVINIRRSVATIFKHHHASFLLGGAQS